MPEKGEKSIYEDYKYGMQDTGRIYVGCKYTFAEFLEEEDVPFKFRLIVEKYVMDKVSPEDTLETHLYYLDQDSFLVRLYRQMKTRIKVNVIEEKKKLLGGSRKEYVTRQLDIDQLVRMTPAQKEAGGLVIQELSVSKLALLGL